MRFRYLNSGQRLTTYRGALAFMPRFQQQTSTTPQQSQIQLTEQSFSLNQMHPKASSKTLNLSQEQRFHSPGPMVTKTEVLQLLITASDTIQMEHQHSPILQLDLKSNHLQLRVSRQATHTTSL